MKPVGVGVIGCGNISSAYLKAAKTFPILDIVALADAVPGRRGSARGGVRPAGAVRRGAARRPRRRDRPQPHRADRACRGRPAGRSPPASTSIRKSRSASMSPRRASLVQAAEAKGLRLGCAPDTFLGGAHQTARQCVDEGMIGRPIGGTAFFMCPGHERWHPNPGFLLSGGGGPMLDMGPYYVTDLVNLLGPVESVIGVATRTRAERLIASEPLEGNAHSGRGRDACHGHAGLRQRRRGDRSR